MTGARMAAFHLCWELGAKCYFLWKVHFRRWWDYWIHLGMLGVSITIYSFKTPSQNPTFRSVSWQLIIKSSLSCIPRSLRTGQTCISVAVLELRSLSCPWSIDFGGAGLSASNEVPPAWGKPIGFHRSAHCVIQALATQPVLLFVESRGSWAAEPGKRASGWFRILRCDKWAELFDSSQVTCAGEL